MQDFDKTQRFLFENATVRGEIVRLHHSFQTIVAQHAYPVFIRQFLGEMLAVSTLLSSIIKFKGRLTLQFQGKDPLKLVVTQCNHQFELRGLAQYQENITEDSFISALQKGILAILINPDSNTQGYQGVVAWQGNSLAHSIEGYFQHSEQLPTRVWLAVNETTVAGLLLQTMPEKTSSQKEKDTDWHHLIHLSDTITSKELLTLDNTTLLHRLYSQEEVRIFEAMPVSFRCTCSVERSVNAVRMLGRQEAEEELRDKQSIVVTCEFCNKEYSFDRAAVENIFQPNDPSSNPIH